MFVLYHSLLTKEWTKRTPRAVLSLLWAEIADAPPDLPFADILRPDFDKSGRSAVDESIVRHIRTFAGFFERRGLPEMPSPETLSAVRASRLLGQAEAAWTYLVLHTLVSLRGEVGFFLDTQSLLFLTAVHYLLPALKEQRPAHDCLVNALAMHVITAWEGRPEHFFYLQSVLTDYLGDEGGAEENLRLSLELTPLEDDSSPFPRPVIFVRDDSITSRTAMRTGAAAKRVVCAT